MTFYWAEIILQRHEVKSTPPNWEYVSQQELAINWVYKTGIPHFPDRPIWVCLGHSGLQGSPVAGHSCRTRTKWAGAWRLGNGMAYFWKWSKCVWFPTIVPKRIGHFWSVKSPGRKWGIRLSSKSPSNYSGMKIWGSLARHACFELPHGCLLGKLQYLSFVKVSEEVIVLFCVAGVVFRNIPTCFITCRKSFRVTRAILLRRFQKMTSMMTSIFRGRCRNVILRGMRNIWDTLHSTLYNLHFTLCTLRFKLYTSHFTLDTSHSTLYTLHFGPFTLNFTLRTLHSTPHTVHL